MTTSVKRDSAAADDGVPHHSGTSETLKDQVRELMARYGLNEKEIDDLLSHRGELPEALRSGVLTKIPTP